VTSPAEESAKLAAARINKTVFNGMIQMHISENDSLKKVIQSCRAEIFLNKVIQDSLLDQNTRKDRLLDEYELQLSDKDNKIVSLTRRKTSSKELAKTYESMKPEEMRAILAKVDNKTIVTLYESMSSRNRKNLLQALSVDRAATLTTKMAGS